MDLEDIQDFDDFTWQRLQIDTEYIENNTSPNTRNSVAARYEPTQGGLDRGEIAELVAIIPNGIQDWVQDAGRVDDGSLSWNVSAMGFPRSTETRSESIVNQEAGFTDAETDASSVFNFRELHAMQGIHYPSFEDQTNGAGGPGSVVYFPHRGAVNYRDWFGHGPLFFDDESVQMSLEVQSKGFGSSQVEFHPRYAVYWDVYETTDQRVKDILGEGGTR